MTLDAAQALGNLPQGLRAELLTEYAQLTRNYREGRWKASELDAGRFCEIVYTILAGYLGGQTYPNSGVKPRDLKSACDDLARQPKAAGPDSIRVTIPRVLIGLYQVRNNRGVAHVGGEVDANHMDATYALHACQWVMAELVRIFHATDVHTATATVEALVERTVPTIWAVGNVKRILNTSLSLADSTLLLLYAEPAGELDRALASHLEQSRITDYRRRVLTRLHRDRLIEYDATTGLALLSPKGATHVEQRLLPETTAASPGR